MNETQEEKSLSDNSSPQVRVRVLLYADDIITTSNLDELPGLARFQNKNTDAGLKSIEQVGCMDIGSDTDPKVKVNFKDECKTSASGEGDSSVISCERDTSESKNEAEPIPALSDCSSKNESRTSKNSTRTEICC